MEKLKRRMALAKDTLHSFESLVEGRGGQGTGDVVRIANTSDGDAKSHNSTCIYCCKIVP